MGRSNGINIPEWLTNTGAAACPSCSSGKGRGFLEKNMETIASFLKDVLEPEPFADKSGLLQAIDPRARLSGVLLLIAAAAVLKNAIAFAGFLALILTLAIASDVPLYLLFKRVRPVILFTLLLILPSALIFITPGAPVLKIFSMKGIETISIILLRVASMASLLSILILTTGYADIFRALQSFPVPRVFVTALSFTFRYILILIKTAEDSHLARKARTLKPLTVKEGQGWLASRIWLIIERSREMGEDVYLAMKARGFAGEVKTMALFKMRGRDYIWVGFAMFIFFLAVQI